LVFRFNTSDIAEMREDLNEVADRATELYDKGVVTLDEARAMVELPPIDGGTEIKTVAAPVAIEGSRYEGKADDINSDGPIGEYDEAGIMERELKKEFERQKAASAAMIAKGLTPDMAVIGASLGAVITNALSEVYEVKYKADYAAITGATGPQIDRAYDVVSHKLKQTIADQSIIISNETLDYTGKSLTQMQTKIRSALVEAGIEGDNTKESYIKALTEGSDRVFDEATDYRAKRIAITESSRAMNDAQTIAGSESGVVQGWVPDVKADACELCQVYDSDNKPTGQPLYPYTSAADADAQIGIYGGSVPPFHPNCKCGKIEVFIDETAPRYASMAKLPQEGKKVQEPSESKKKKTTLNQFISDLVEETE